MLQVLRTYYSHLPTTDITRDLFHIETSLPLLKSGRSITDPPHYINIQKASFRFEYRHE